MNKTSKKKFFKKRNGSSTSSINNNYHNNNNNNNYYSNINISCSNLNVIVSNKQKYEIEPIKKLKLKLKNLENKIKGSNILTNNDDE